MKQIQPFQKHCSLPASSSAALTNVFCTSDPNLVNLAWMGDELWCGQAQNEVNLDVYLKFDLEGHGRSLHKTIGTLTKLFYTFDPNLVTLTWSSGLLRGQASDWHTDWHTHRHTDAGNNKTRKPKLASGKNEVVQWNKYHHQAIMYTIN